MAGRATVRKIAELCLIAMALSLMTGCAMSGTKQGLLSGSFVGGILGHLTPYSESILGPPKPPSPTLLAQQSPSTHVLELVAVPTPESTPTPAAAASVGPPAMTPAAPSQTPASAQPPLFVSNEKIVLRGVLFERNSAELDDLDELILDDAVRTLKAHPNVRIYVKGYSDSRGSARLNQRLSQERAANVAAYLVGNGVPLSQLIVLGKGTTHPVAGNDTAAGRALNRRVELEPVME
jgi:outer membrane protein OmpA-like peptidoglycan-associated protein